MAYGSVTVGGIFKSNLGPFFGQCSLKSGVATQTVTVEDETFELKKGVTINVQFIGDSGCNLDLETSLNVNNTGSKQIMISFSDMKLGNKFRCFITAGDIIQFTYNGTQWQPINSNVFSRFTIRPIVNVTVPTAGTSIQMKQGSTTLTLICGSGGTPVSFYLPTLGEWTITTGNYTKVLNVDTAKIYNINAMTLESASWSQIAEASESGIASDLWSVGDEKTFTIGSETYAAVILGFDHDPRADGGGMAGITFGLKQVMTTRKSMNATDTNAGGYVGSAMFTYLKDDVYSSLPQGIRSFLKEVNKEVVSENNAFKTKTEKMNIFLFSVNELFGNAQSTYSLIEGNQYEYFATVENRKKKSIAGGSYSYWTRTPNHSTTTRFAMIDTNGKLNTSSNYDKESAMGSICFGFCI